MAGWSLNGLTYPPRRTWIVLELGATEGTEHEPDAPVLGGSSRAHRTDPKLLRLEVDDALQRDSGPSGVGFDEHMFERPAADGQVRGALRRLAARRLDELFFHWRFPHKGNCA